MKKELGAVKTVVATGGLAHLIAPDCPSVQVVDETLSPSKGSQASLREESADGKVGE